LFLSDPIEKLVLVRSSVIEWREAYYHLVSQNSDSPPIYSESLLVTVHYFRSHVIRSTAEGASALYSSLHFLSESKIGQSEEATLSVFSRYQNVLRL